ncbi:MAG: phytoene dehydrogenase [Polyangiaceae bacterium]|nr:phytoene dehydrogenase [Polyangiaceae bacterium]MCW5792317.1 phytoene dehydrogenase [Polyangiaceae bacterium]
MTPTRYYDVVVLGRSIGSLAAAALLARRDFRVLLLGHGARPAGYQFEHYQLRRRTFTLLAGSSPVWLRVLQELAQATTFRRRTQQLDPMYAVLSPRRRLEVPPEAELFAREIDREFPEVRQLVDELYSSFASVNTTLDTAFERDVAWPPGTFWERLETARVSRELPLTRGETTQELLGKFPASHPYRDVTTIPAGFATDLAVPGEQLPPLAFARLSGAWTRGVQALAGGEAELESFFLERIRAHGGESRLSQRASQIVIAQGRVVGVLEDGEDEPVGTSSVVCDLSGEAVAELTGGEGITQRAQRDWPRLSVNAGRFVVSLVVPSRTLPEPLPTESFFLPEEGSTPSPRRPVVHVQRGPRFTTEDSREREPLEVLTAEMLLPSRGSLTLLEAREAVLSTLRTHLPFVEDEARVIDSPHDGLPLWEYRQGTSGTRRHEIDRIHLPGGAGPEPMEWQWSVDTPGYLELAGEPFRGPIPGTYLVGRTVLPALGQEGSLLAAWGAARAITRKDRTRQKMRRQMWSKIET